ncbi:hypothetical protein ONZ45_g4516 [Pleurotus djamor]|nr:hypothetical protein ONZ45_g4516 [Pleurotus djamor]
MLRLKDCVLLVLSAVSPAVYAVSSQAYSWNNVKIGGGGGFVPGIVFNTAERGVAYCRTDIGGAYKLNADNSWTPLLDFADHPRWNYWGVDALATDPVQPNRLYLATGLYTNSWDPNNGQILISTDYGATFTPSPLPFKVGGNMPGRGMGERLAIDPRSNNILFFGARSGNGLWKSTNYGATWTKVNSFTSTGTYIQNPSDPAGYANDIVGISFVTFDSTSGSSGSPTPRIFVGVATVGANNIFVSNDAGATWSPVAGQITTFLPHKGVLSPAENTLYVSYSDGAGPYDGEGGAIYKYNIATSTWTNITPVSGSDLYFGFGGVAVDLQNPGTVMVAALNSWWPEGQIFRSTNGGSTWSPLWDWAASGYPNMNKYYSYSNSLAPWLGPNHVVTEAGYLQVGWMMEALVIDPFDSDHCLYGTGATIYGGHDLTRWDGANRNVSISSLADGIEETAILGLISPPTGPTLISAVGDIQGFVHNSITTAPSHSWTNPEWSTTSDVDFAGNNPSIVVRIGTGDSSQGKQVAISSNAGSSWSQHSGAADNVNGDKVALSANGDTILWRTNSNGIQVSKNQANFATVSSLPAGAAFASDKLDNNIFYAASGNTFYLSTNGATSFTTRGTLGSSTSVHKVIVHPGVTGDVWVSTDKGIFHSTNSGTSFTSVSGVTQAWAIALGAPASTGGYPTLFAAADIEGVGYFRSDDTGLNWVKINDAQHGFGNAASNPISGDPRKYGRVYIGTNGRGIFYGDATGSQPPTTASSTISSAWPSSSSSIPTSSAPPTSSVSRTSTSSVVTTPTPTGTPNGPWAQCGGQNWTGLTTCVAGYTCVVGNPYYSQCVAV